MRYNGLVPGGPALRHVLRSAANSKTHSTEQSDRSPLVAACKGRRARHLPARVRRVSYDQTMTRYLSSMTKSASTVRFWIPKSTRWHQHTRERTELSFGRRTLRTQASFGRAASRFRKSPPRSRFLLESWFALRTRVYASTQHVADTKLIAQAQGSINSILYYAN